MICISIQEKHRGKVISLANTAQMAEIRIDLCGLKEKDVAFVFSKTDAELIATCRPENVSDADRIQLLKTAIESGAKYVDIELEADKQVKDAILPLAKKKNCKVIISYHNYELTPSDSELHTIYNDCKNSGADIVKIATTATSIQDSARILNLYSTHSNIVALAMGELGKITRVAGVSLGSPFTFAAASDEKITAPGQYSSETLKSIFDLV